MTRHRAALVAVLLALLVWTLALALLIGWTLVGVTRWAAEGRTMPAFTEATLNVRGGNPARSVATDVRAAMARASIVRLQEVWSPGARAGVRRALASHPTWRHYPALTSSAGADVVLWSPRWVRAGPAGVRLLTRGVRHLTPARWLVWVTLARRVPAAGRVPVTVANTHAVSGYCHARSSRAALRDAIAGAHWRRVATWTRQHRRISPRAPAVLLGGDFNCSPWATGPGTPGQYLRGLYVFDSPRRGIDRLLTSRTPGAPVTIARWSRPAYSDHRLQLRTLTLPR